MPNIGLDTTDANEPAELLQLLTDWPAADAQTLDTSPTGYLDNPAYNLEQLRNDLHRFGFLLGGNDGEPLFAP
jgi:hypothetical protein